MVMISDITTRHGLLYLSGEEVSLPAADHLAQEHGHFFAERFVRALQARIAASSAPVAWMGLSPDSRTARICAYCPDKNAADARANALNLQMTHGICPECNAKFLASIP